MDITNQDKLKNWLIIVLITLNVISIAFIWKQPLDFPEPANTERPGGGSGAVSLLKKALDLTDYQALRINKMLADYLEQTKEYNDRLNKLKINLAENVFQQKSDSAIIYLLTREIGELQSAVELIRFRHFEEILGICTSGQKDKLKPILISLVAGKPAEGEPADRQKPFVENNPETPRLFPDNQKKRMERESEKQAPPGTRDERTEPPSVEDKLAKISERINLTPEQSQKIREVLARSNQQGEVLRMKINMDRGEVEREKERIRNEEDEGVLKILSAEQMIEYKNVIGNRR